MFLQQTINAPVTARVIDTLKKNGSPRLMQIAATLKSGGHFDAVTGEIDKMKEVVKAEEKKDIADKDWCKEEKHKNEQEAAQFEYKIEVVDAHVARLRVKLEELETFHTETVASIAATKD